MYAVSTDYLDKIKAQARQILGRVHIDYTDPNIDNSITVTTSEAANFAQPDQTADGVDSVMDKWAVLDGTWVLDGTFKLAPDPSANPDQTIQVGWWGTTFSDPSTGAFVAPYPTLTVDFFSRPINSLHVAGDSVLGEYPVDFAITLYDANNNVLLSQPVTGNTQVIWGQVITPTNQCTKMVLEVHKWSAPGRQVKIAEFFTSIRQTYEGDDIISIDLVEEREVNQASLPVGNISANQISIKLNNQDRRFDADNAASPLYELLKPQRHVQAWLGIDALDLSGVDGIQWVPLGEFWTTEWQAPEDTVEASLVARDRLELMRTTTYQTSQVIQNTNLYNLAVAILQDYGLSASQYNVDTALQSVAVPYAWFNATSHRDALRTVAEAGLANVYCDRDGVLQVIVASNGASAETITPDDYFKRDNPMQQQYVANIISVNTQPLKPGTSQEIYRNNDPISVPAGGSATITAFYNNTPCLSPAASLVSPPAGVSISGATYYGWGANITIQNTGGTAASVTVSITGQPLTVQNKQQASAQDSNSITDNGPLQYNFPDNPLVQTLAVAQQIANSLLASFKDSRRDLSLDWRGNPALLLGDVVTVKGTDFAIYRQEIQWDGGLSAQTSARKV